MSRGIGEGKELIRIARDTINNFFEKKGAEISIDIKKRFSEKRGVFVTLKDGGMLRGCIGFAEPVFPLWEAVAKAAEGAAFSDPRFMPLSREEYGRVNIEVSVLSVPEPIDAEKRDDYPKKIEIGKDGLIVEKGMMKGLLLPQVFVEHPCDPEGALDMACEKAGIPPGSWKDKDCRVWKFHARIFSG